MKLIYFYNILNIILFPVYCIILLIRIINRKENFCSIIERFSIKLKVRPHGKIIWLHAASVGESMIAMTMVEAFKKKYPEHNFLITTGTISSFNMIEKWMPSNVHHQFVPLDNFFTVKRFLNHWRPDLAIFIESELWPCILSSSAEKCPLLLINARLSDKSYNRWDKMKSIFCSIMKPFSLVITQSEKDLNKYQSLGCTKSINLGNIKFSNKKLELSHKEFEELQRLFSGRKIFVAGSTHSEDEEVILKIITDFKDKGLNYYPIIVLRHPERRNDISTRCKKLGLKFTLKSTGAYPSLKDDLYVVDSFGELGLFYSLAFIVFVGGSFKQGGHNPLEPSYFDNTILVGPNMTNCQDIITDMIKAKSVLQIMDKQSLADQIEFFLNPKNKDIAQNFAINARNFVENNDGILKKYMSKIEKFIK